MVARQSGQNRPEAGLNKIEHDMHAPRDRRRFPEERVPEATRLRRDGQLWPETLSDDELRQEVDSVRADVSPISSRMLHDEWNRRQSISPRLRK